MGRSPGKEIEMKYRVKYTWRKTERHLPREQEYIANSKHALLSFLSTVIDSTTAELVSVTPVEE